MFWDEMEVVKVNIDELDEVEDLIVKVNERRNANTAITTAFCLR